MSASGGAFVVGFKELQLWSVGSFVSAGWHWPAATIKPLSTALVRKQAEITGTTDSNEFIQLLTIHFDGSIEPRESGSVEEFKGKLYLAEAGDVIYSKIDVRNGAIGLVPADMPRCAVSSEYPVYRVRSDVALGEYIKLVFRTSHFRQVINGMISGASGRKRVQPEQIVSVNVPLPPLATQRAIVTRWQVAQTEFESAKSALRLVVDDLDKRLFESYRRDSKQDILGARWLAVRWDEMPRWDVKTARAAAFRAANPAFRPLGEFAEEATELMKPWEQPEKDWPVYGVNNKDGVFFSYYQKGAEFTAPYKRIRRDWFFHNPTRSSVGSLGIVPEVSDDALTSPEYQVWRIKQGLLPGYGAVLVNTPFFISLIQFHRVGAVKQRLYVENLLEIPIPILSEGEQQAVAEAREIALRRIAASRQILLAARAEVEAMILGTQPVAGD